jgi:hypothetical protein
VERPIHLVECPPRRHKGCWALSHLIVARVFLIALCLFTGVATLRATLTVIGMNTNTASGTPSAAEGYTFENGQRSVTTFTTASSTYGIASQADNVFVRRNAVNNNQSSVWYTSSGVGTNLSGIHQNAYGPLLTSNNIFAGSDNTFANGTVNTTGNIERLDFTWNSGLTVSNSLAFAVFDRGAVGVHDSFAIAAVTAIDASGNPTAYGSLLGVAAGWGGATNPIADFNYRLFRYNNGDILTASTANTEVGTQGIGGIVITPTDLGLTVGTTIYGYSLMAMDVTATTSAQLLDWTNGTFYPTTTDGTTGGGGIDLAALNGMAFIIVPEPAPSAGLLGAFVALVSICHCVRTRQSRRP